MNDNFLGLVGQRQRHDVVLDGRGLESQSVVHDNESFLYDDDVNYLPTSHTGSTAQTVIHSLLIPAEAFTQRGRLAIQVGGTASGSGGKTISVRANGTNVATSGGAQATWAIETDFASAASPYAQTSASQVHEDGVLVSEDSVDTTINTRTTEILIELVIGLANAADTVDVDSFSAQVTDNNVRYPG